METKELESLQRRLVEELADFIVKMSDKEDSYIGEIQPPEPIVYLAAEAAASVLMAFERGYRMA